MTTRQRTCNSWHSAAMPTQQIHHGHLYYACSCLIAFHCLFPYNDAQVNIKLSPYQPSRTSDHLTEYILLPVSQAADSKWTLCIRTYSSTNAAALATFLTLRSLMWAATWLGREFLKGSKSIELHKISSVSTLSTFWTFACKLVPTQGLSLTVILYINNVTFILSYTISNAPQYHGVYAWIRFASDADILQIQMFSFSLAIELRLNYLNVLFLHQFATPLD